MHWKRPGRLLVLGVVVAAIAVVAPDGVAHAAANPAGQSSYTPGPVDWAPCDQDATAQCGVLRVPVDWADPDGPTIGLALARRPATDPSERIGTLIINPGGPGGSGVSAALGESFDDELTRHFDILGFDPRGVGASSPIMCSLDLLNQVPSLVETQADFDHAVSAGRALADDCRARSGPVFDHVDTLETVQDIDAIRASAGDSQLSFFGMSYGTLMAQQYAERFPDRLRAIVSDSNMDHSLDAKGFATTQAATDEDTFNEFVKGCGQLPDCALHGRNIRQFWSRLLDRAARGELPDPDDPSYKITQADLTNFVIGSLTYGPYWTDVAAELVRLDEGRPSGQSTTSTPPPSGQVINFVYQATMCQDWSLGAPTYSAWNVIRSSAQHAAPDLPGLTRSQVGSICLGWPGSPTNPPHPLGAHNTTPVLMVDSRHDPATSYQWASSTAAQFGSHATLLTYDGWGHIVYGRTSCVDDRIDQYLITQALPAAGTECAAVLPEEPAASAADTAGRASRADAMAGAPAAPAPTAPAQVGGAAPSWREFRASTAPPTWSAGLPGSWAAVR